MIYTFGKNGVAVGAARARLVDSHNLLNWIFFSSFRYNKLEAKQKLQQQMNRTIRIIAEVESQPIKIM